MDPVGTIALAIFLFAVVGSIRGWIPQRVLPIQTALLLAAVIITVAGLAFGEKIRFGEFVTATSLHPITATIAGFIFAGALKSAGGFDAATDMLKKIMRTPLGAPFAVMLLVNIPTVFAMPCGRIWVAPLLPVAMMIGYELAREKNDRLLPSMVVFGLIVNAAASCGPSLIGGIGTLGEGMGRYPAGSFSNPQSIAIVVITVAVMALIKYVFKIAVDPVELQTRSDNAPGVPEHGYFSFILFVAVLAVTVVVNPPIPLQAILVILTVIVMIVARLSFNDLMQGIMLHPLTAMISGFIVAGALSAFGGFAALLQILEYIARNTPLGYMGVALILIYLPVIFPMPCGRILAVSLIPAALMYGERLAEVTGHPELQSVMLIAFILSGAASCGPSPLGGIGCIGEGNLQLRGFVSGKPQALGILLGVPVAALMVSFMGLSASLFSFGFTAVSLTLCTICGILTNVLLGYRAYHPGGILGGAAIGILMVIF